MFCTIAFMQMSARRRPCRSRQQRAGRGEGFGLFLGVVKTSGHQAEIPLDILQKTLFSRF
jgi:hypothetical protein